MKIKTKLLAVLVVSAWSISADTLSESKPFPAGPESILQVADEPDFFGAGPIDTTKLDSITAVLLAQAKMILLSEPLLDECRQLIDLQMTKDSTVKWVWLRLAELRLIYYADTGDPAPVRAAYARAFSLDTIDCHIGALTALFSDSLERKRMTERLLAYHSPCAETYYLKAMYLDSAAERVADFQKAQRVASSAECLIELGRAYLSAGDWSRAFFAFDSARTAPQLFPDYWRNDVWVKLHSFLGIAYTAFRRGDRELSQKWHQEVVDILAEPGPWHDLDSAEGNWREALDQAWPNIRPSWMERQ